MQKIAEEEAERRYMKHSKLKAIKGNRVDKYITKVK